MNINKIALQLVKGSIVEVKGEEISRLFVGNRTIEFDRFLLKKAKRIARYAINLYDDVCEWGKITKEDNLWSHWFIDGTLYTSNSPHRTRRMLSMDEELIKQVKLLFDYENQIESLLAKAIYQN